MTAQTGSGRFKAVRNQDNERKAKPVRATAGTAPHSNSSSPTRVRAVTSAARQTSIIDDLPCAEDGRSIDPGLLLELFGQAPIVFNRIYIDITGSIQAALWLAYAIYHVCERETAPSSWFSKSQQEWMLETGLSRREQESARQRLRILGVIEEKRSPNAPLAYRIVMDRLYALMEIHSQQIKAAYLAARSAPEK